MTVAGTVLLLAVSNIRDRLGSSTRAGAARPPVIAVLPFRNIAATPRFDYLAIGITEGLRNGLARNPGLGGIVASASAQQLAGSETIGEKLGAERVVEGTSFSDGSRVRFEVRLSDRGGGVLWSGRFEKPAPQILALQEEVVLRVSQVLGTELQLERRRRIRSIDPEAYRLLVHSRLTTPSLNLLHSGVGYATPGHPADPLETIRHALRIAPDYADAHQALADVLFSAYYSGEATRPSSDVLSEALEHANRAIELDAGSGLAYASRARIRLYLNGDFKGAEADYGRALALAPASFDVMSSWSWYLGEVGRFDDCLQAAERAEALDPLTSNMSSAWCLFLAGRYPESATRIEEANARSAPAEFANLLLMMAYARSGRLAEARALREEVRKTRPPGQRGYVDWALVDVHVAEGDLEGARRLAETWWRREDTRTEWGWIVQMYGSLDDAERVIQGITRSAPKGLTPGELLLWQVNPFLPERARRDPRLRALLRTGR